LKISEKKRDGAAPKDEDMVSWVEGCLRIYEAELMRRGDGSNALFRGLDGLESEKTIAVIDLNLHRFLEIWAFERLRTARSTEMDGHDFADRIAKARNYHRSVKQRIAEISGLEQVGTWNPETRWSVLEMLKGIATHSRDLERLDERRKGNQGILLMIREAEEFISQLWVLVESNHNASISFAKGALEPEERKIAIMRLSDHVSFLEHLMTQLFRESSFSGEKRIRVIAERVEAVNGMLREANETKKTLDSVKE
jgi:hypothetical protein